MRTASVDASSDDKLVMSISAFKVSPRDEFTLRRPSPSAWLATGRELRASAADNASAVRTAGMGRFFKASPQWQWRALAKARHPDRNRQPSNQSRSSQFA